MSRPIHEQFEAQLLQIELAVMQACDAHPDLTDVQLDSAYEELARCYRTKATSHNYRPSKLVGPRQEVHDPLLPITELLVGRSANMAPEPEQVITAEEMRLCLNRLRSSIKTWSSQERQSYLKYISQ